MQMASRLLHFSSQKLDLGMGVILGEPRHMIDFISIFISRGSFTATFMGRRRVIGPGTSSTVTDRIYP
jgi:hypothetical protein